MTDNRWKRYYQKNKEYHANRSREYYLKRLMEWYEWLEEIGKNRCEMCGFDDHPKAIDFHHVEPKDKSFGIGKFTNGRMCNDQNKKIVKQEIDKCICLCANCHRIKHFVDANERSKKK